MANMTVETNNVTFQPKFIGSRFWTCV